MASPAARGVGCLVLALVILAGAGVAVFFWLQGRGITVPIPGQQRCVATGGGLSVALTLDQAHFASIIVGESVRRKLPPRASSIALATAYQESGIRNLNYGDQDSLGLFQQRPSQGWGTQKQLMDPYYATNKFYSALVKIKDWETSDITEVAQKVQRSGSPDAYRQHEGAARTLASVLTGHSPGGLSCLDRTNTPGDAAGLVSSVKKTFGSTVAADAAGNVVTVTAPSATLAWAYGHFAVANTTAYGVVTATVGNQVWKTDTFTLPQWSGATPALTDTTVKVTVRP